MTNIPKSKFTVGDRVLVRDDDASPGAPPSFPAQVCEVKWSSARRQHEYAVMEKGVYTSDGYTDRDFTEPLPLTIEEVIALYKAEPQSSEPVRLLRKIFTKLVDLKCPQCQSSVNVTLE